MARSRDQERRRKLMERAKKRGNHVPFKATFRMQAGAAVQLFVNVVANGFDRVRKNIRNYLKPNEIQAINEYVVDERPLGVRARQRFTAALNKIGDAVYDYVLTVYRVPFGTYIIEPSLEPGIIDVQCSSFRESKSKYGTRYYYDNNLIISTDGDTGVKSSLKIGYTRHFLERAMERDLDGSPMQKHQSLFKHLTNDVVLMKVTGLYRFYVKADERAHDMILNQLGLKEGDIYCCIGYVPESIDDGFYIAKTILLPGMRGTPEYRIKKLRDASHLLDTSYLTALADAGLPLLIHVCQNGNDYKIIKLENEKSDCQATATPPVVTSLPTHDNSGDLIAGQESRRDVG